MSRVKTAYTEHSIQKGGEGPDMLRKRPQTLLGSADMYGAEHAIWEIIANSTDEASAGFGSTITITVFDDNSVEVEDHGRGVPMAWNPVAKMYNWELVFNTLYSSGKGNKDAAYNDSEGLNGCGCTAAQYTSDFLNVTSVRQIYDENDQPTGEYHRYEMHFKNGWPVGELKDEKLEGQHPTGTKVHLKPSAEVFNSEVEIPKENFISRMALKSITQAGLRLTLYYKGTEPISFYYEGGMVEFLENNVEKPINEEPINISGTNSNCNDDREKRASRTYEGKMECCIMFSSESGVQSTFHNGTLLKGGPTHDAVFKGIANVLTIVAQKSKVLAPKETFTPSDVSNIVSFVCQTRCNADYSLYEHQTKTAVKNPSLVKLITGSIEIQLGRWCVEHQLETQSVIEYAIANKSARESIDKVRRQAIKQLSQDIHKIGKAPKGFLDCNSKDPSKTEIYLIEGESAKGSTNLARDENYQAVIALRGKILNCLKKSIEHVLAENSLVLALLTVFGCGIELTNDTLKKLKLPSFDEKKLNFHKIILAADADVDGGHIIVLLLVMIWVLCPSLLRRGYVYTVKTPLYRVTCAKRSEYFYSDEDKERCVRTLLKNGAKMSQITVKRFKGLGEMDAKELRDTIMHKDKRVLQQLQCPENEAELSRLLQTLMGNDIAERRELIIQNFATANVITE